MRNRSLGDFVKVNETEKMVYRKSVAGCTWKEFNMPIKEICRNDRDRILLF